jgi:hypothetical protein
MNKPLDARSAISPKRPESESTILACPPQQRIVDATGLRSTVGRATKESRVAPEYSRISSARVQGNSEIVGSPRNLKDEHLEPTSKGERARARAPDNVAATLG